MKITVADNSGFCFGVKRALEITENEIKKQLDKSSEDVETRDAGLFTCGPLIHNEGVTDELKRKGCGIIDSLSEAEAGDTVIVRSHGETESFYKEAADKGVTLVDATCPFVSKIHNLVKEASSVGKTIIIVGDPNHQEVIATAGWCNSKPYIVESKDDAMDIPQGDYFLVCQTTIRKEILDEISLCLKERGIFPEIQNTICNATTLRQDSCAKLAKESDAMVVIGGKNSSNTAKLFEISKTYCANSFFAENISDLPLKELEKYNKIGVSAGASTPQSAIKEVIAKMSEVITNQNAPKESMDDFMDVIESSLRLPKNGEIVTGTVHQVSDKEVIVNLGYKKDGVLPAEEVSLEEGQTLTDVFKPDDEIQAKVIKTDDGDGSILLSKKRLELSEHWTEINEAHENHSIINVKITKAVNGGVIAAYKEVTGFIPMSQLSDRYVEADKAEEYIGETMDVRVTRVDPRKNRAVFSHKAVIMEEKQKQIANIWENLHVGDVVEGTVMRFTDYGAFVDIGGLDGLLHISEISWGKLRHPEEVLEINQKVNVKILSMNQEKNKISLGLKQITPEPWSVIDEKYQIGAVVPGKVVQIKEYGAFVELEPGLDGLVHISEVANKRVANISDELTVGQEVNTKILDIDTERKRISLSIKATMDDAEAPEEASEEAPADEVEAAPVEEAPVEEAAAVEAVEEAPAEEAVEEAPVEEASEEVAETEEASEAVEEAAEVTEE